MLNIIFATLLGIGYGFVSVKGQFCMNSGFSNVIRKQDTTKLKSFILAILIPLAILPIVFYTINQFPNTKHLISNITPPSTILYANIIGGFFFGISMYYSAGCGAGIFYKIGERNSGALLSVLGFIIGIFLFKQPFIQQLFSFLHYFSFDQPFLFTSEFTLLMATILFILSSISIYVLLKKKDHYPSGAVWGWKKTGVLVGIIGVLGWITALYFQNSYSIAIIPGVQELLSFHFSWGFAMLIGIIIGAYLASDKSKTFSKPKQTIIGKRILGGIGLGISGSLATGCTVGHGLTFTPLLGLGSIITIVFIFLGSGFMGYLTRKK
ncbi:MAG: YeeE/YedE thiosulfate transporter family protein [Flavobacteriales bacterium]